MNAFYPRPEAVHVDGRLAACRAAARAIAGAGAAASLSDAELVALFLGTGLRGKSALASARELLAPLRPRVRACFPPRRASSTGARAWARRSTRRSPR